MELGEKLLHFDPVNLLMLLVGVGFIYATLRSDSQWHTEWIKRHSSECDAKDKLITEILVELRTSNARLIELTAFHSAGLAKLEEEQLRQRDRAHDLANQLFTLKGRQ